MEKRHFLFGSQELMEYFEDHRLGEGLREHLEKGFSLGKYVKGDEPDNLMSLAQMHETYVEITEEDYNEIVDYYFNDEIIN
jgi:hypothetical protein